jgi:hypothetical protein
MRPVERGLRVALELIRNIRLRELATSNAREVAAPAVLPFPTTARRTAAWRRSLSPLAALQPLTNAVQTGRAARRFERNLIKRFCFSGTIGRPSWNGASHRHGGLGRRASARVQLGAKAKE